MDLVRLPVTRAALAWVLILISSFAAFGAPDLRVTDISAPASAAPGETITVVWTITNAGDTTANAPWDDRLFLATISTPRPAIDKPLTEPLARSVTLAPGATYTRTSSGTIPADRPPGTSYLIGSVDVGGQVTESNEANNAFARTISIVRSDLVVSSLTAPATGVPGETVSISWVVTNLGPGTAIGTWTDKLYLSPDAVLDIGGAAPDTVAASAPHTGPLAVGGAYTNSLTVKLPNVNQTGSYLILRVNDGGQLAEANAANNDANRAVTLALPDLQIAEFNAPAEADQLQEITVTWRVHNAGTATAYPTWKDQVYLSKDNQWSADDLALGTATSRTTSLEANGDYVGTAKVILPKYEIGNYFLIVRTDSENSQSDRNQSNNYRVNAVSLRPQELVLGGPPRVANLTTGFYDVYRFKPGAGKRVIVQLQQIGAGRNDLFIGTNPQPWLNPLQQDKNYVNDRYISMDATTGDTYYVGVFNVQDNNSNGYKLQAYEVDSIPELALGGDERVANLTTGFYDVYRFKPGAGKRVIVQLQQIGAGRNELFIGTNPQPWGDPLQQDKNYVNDRYLSMNVTTGDTYYVGVFNAQDNNSNGYKLQAYEVDSIPEIVLGGDERVANLTTGFYDVYRFKPGAGKQVIFQLQQIGAGKNDIFVGTNPLPWITPLLVDKHYINERRLTLNLINDNTYYIGVYNLLDGRGNGYKLLSGSTETLPNLHLDAGSEIPHAVGNQRFLVTWRVQNRGGRPARPNWRDQVILSRDTLWDGGDIELASPVTQNRELSPGAVYFASAEVTIPANQPPGSYYLLIVTDRDDVLFEPDESDNLVTIPLKIILPTGTNAPSLTLTSTNQLPALGHVVFSPDSLRLAASGGNLAYQWDIPRGKLTAAFSGHTAPIDSVAFSPVGDMLLTGGRDGFVREWDTGTRQQVFSYPTLPGSVNPAAYSLDGSRVIAAWGEGLPTIWDAVALQEIEQLGADPRFPGHLNQVSAVALSPDGKLALSADLDKVALLWDVATNKPLYRWTSHTGNILASGFSPDGFWAMTASADGTIRLWNTTNGEAGLVFVHGTGLTDAAWSRDGRYLVSCGGSPARAYVWDATSGARLHVVAPTDGGPNLSPMNGAALSPDNTRIATTHADGRVRLWGTGLSPAPLNPIKPLAVGTSLSATLRPHGLYYYELDVPPGRSVVVSAKRRSGSVSAPEITDFRMVVGRGRLPSTYDTDLASVASTSDSRAEVPLQTVMGEKFYVLLFSPYIASSSIEAEISAEFSDFAITSVQPATGGNAGSITALIQGTGLTGDTVVRLVGSGGAQVVGQLVFNSDTTRQFVTFDLHGLAPGDYTLQVERPGHGVGALPKAFSVNSGVGPRLEANLTVPQAMRPNRDYVLSLEYANVGDGDMAAPLFLITANVPGIDPNVRIIDGQPVHLLSGTLPPPQKVGELHVLGLNQAGPPGVIPPGGHFTIQVTFASPSGPAHLQLNFGLQVLRADATPIDWNDLGAKLQPTDVDPALWAAVFANFKATVGNTWADYLRVLDSQANLLAQSGSPTLDHGRLLAAAIGRAAGGHLQQTLAASVDASAPSPGLPLAFSRVSLSGLEQRFTVGSLGRSWSHNFDFHLSQPDATTVHIAGPGGGVRVFIKGTDGSWIPSAGDFGTLKAAGGGYVLKEKTGLLWRFGGGGLLASVEDPNQNRITLGYAAGFLVSLTHSSGSSFALEYNGNGRLVKLIGYGGQVTEYHYDASGELLTEVKASGNTITRYAYTQVPGQPSDHALTAITFPDGTHQFYAYDVLGRLAEQSRDGGAERLQYAYDAVGNVSVTDAHGKVTSLQLGDRGQPLATRNALGQVANFQYDANFNLTRLIGPDGGVSTIDYDAQGNPTRLINPLGQTVGMAYTELGRLDSLTDARNQLTDFGYDPAGNLSGITYPDSSAEQFNHDARGEVTTLRNRRGQSIILTRNSFGQITQKAYPGGRTTDFSYDSRGNLTNVTDSLQGVTAMRYDARNWLTGITYPDGKGFTFEYNAAGRRTKRTGHDGYVLNYAYDGVGRLARLSDGTGKEIIRYSYDATGRLSREDKGNGTWTTYSYDDAGQILEMVNFGKDGSVISRFAYTYDASGNRTSMTTLAGRTEYSYDRIGQLTGVTYPDGRVVAYAYDAAGNRVTVTDNGKTTAYSANNLNQYTQAGPATFTYDADGNMTSKKDADGATNYDYDLENRLVRVVTPKDGTWEYTYDALGNRVAVAHNGQTAHYVHDPVGLVDVAAEYNNAGGLIARYDYGLGLTSRTEPNGAEDFYNFDALGHIRELTDAAGGIANRYDYDAFGATLQVQETIVNPFRFVGRLGVMDTGSGLQFMRARYYDTQNGRFTSEDPLNFGSGDQNLYLYTDNNPVNIVDPEGLFNFNYPLGAPIRISVFGGGESKLLRVEWFDGKALNHFALSGPRGAHYAVNTGKSYWHFYGNRAFDFVSKSELLYSRRLALFVTKVNPILSAIDIGVTGGLLIDTYWRDNPFGSFVYDLSYSFFTRKLASMFPTRVVTETSATLVLPFDPNDKLGPIGVGPTHALAIGDRLEYMIRFENDPKTATAPVQELTVVDYLDPGLDWTSVRFGALSYGDRIITIPSAATDFSVRDLPPTNSTSITGKTKGPMAVNVSASLNPQTGRLEWRARAIDTKTGLLPEDALAGILPQGNEAGRNGYVTFSVKPKPTTPLGTVITNIASIVFDSNDPIATPPVWNTIADVAPKLAFSVAYAAAEIQPGKPFTYTLTLTNGGLVDVTGITISNSLPAAVTFGSATPTSGTASFGNGAVTWTVGSLAAGGTANLSVTATSGSEGEFDLGFLAMANGGVINIQQPIRLVVGTPAKPSLSVSLINGQVELTWPGTATGYQLQAALVLGDPGAWRALDVTPIASGGLMKAAVGSSSSARYFRLVRP